MKKKIVALFICFTMLFVIMPKTAFATTYMFSDMHQYATIDLASYGITDGDVIVISSGAQYIRLLGSPGTTYRNITISIESHGNTQFIIENLNIACGGHDNSTPLIVHGTNNVMEVRGTCNLTSEYDVGIQVEEGDELTIKGSGTLNVRGTTSGGDPQGDAAIGGRYHKNCGTINIVDCTVTAVGGRLASGIGGGGGHYDIVGYNMVYYPGGNGGTVSISGNAVVYAQGISSDIGGGYKNSNHGSLNISGNAAVFFSQSQDSLVSGFNYSSAHHYYNSSYKFNYTVGGTPASSITPQKLMRITGSSYNATTGVLTVAGESFNVGDTMDTSTLTITGEGGSCTLTSPDVTASSSTSFSVTLDSEEKLTINGILDKNGTASSGGTAYNLSADSNWNATQGADADTTNTVSVSGVLTPTVTSAVYNSATGVLTVTGANMVKTVGSSNDIDASMFTVKGVLGGTFTLTNTSDVEILSQTSFKLILSATDKSSVDVLLDALGNVSSQGDTYNLSAADDWNGYITGGDISDTTGNAIEVIYDAPTPVPTAVPTPAPTAVPTAVPTSTQHRTHSVTHTPAPTSTPAPNATPEPSHTGNTDATPEPTISVVPSKASATPAPIPADITPTDGGRSQITIDISSLPEGTTSIMLPGGETVSLDGAQDGMLTFELDDSLVAYGGTVEIIAVGEDETALGSYAFTVPVTSPGLDEHSRVLPIWVWILIAVVAFVWGTIFISRKKVPASGSKYRRR